MTTFYVDHHILPTHEARDVLIIRTYIEAASAAAARSSSREEAFAALESDPASAVYCWGPAVEVYASLPARASIRRPGERAKVPAPCGKSMC